VDLACELAKRPACRVEPEARENADGARSERDTRRSLEEFAPVDDATLCLEGPYELDVTAPRRRSAVALPQREIASAAEEIPPSHHNRPIPRTYRAPIPIQLNMNRA